MSWIDLNKKKLEINSHLSFPASSLAVTVGGAGGDVRWRVLMVTRQPDWSPWLCRAQQRPPWWGLLMEGLCQSSSIHVYVFLHRNVGVNSGRSDQLALAESGLLTLDTCWVVLSINPSDPSWSWCSILSFGSAKHTATFTLQLPLSVSLPLSSVTRVSSRTSCWPLESSTAQICWSTSIIIRDYGLL